MLTNRLFALTLTTFVAALLGCGDNNKEQKIQDDTVRVGSGVLLYEGIEPNTLFLGKRIGDTAQQCVRAVTVRDHELACMNNRCDIKAFHLPVREVSNGQRALHVVPCNVDPELVKGHLLTDKSADDSSGILYFQANRSGDEMWKQIIGEDGNYSIEFPTEAAEGTLKLDDQGQYVWDELPD